MNCKILPACLLAVLLLAGGCIQNPRPVPAGENCGITEGSSNDCISEHLKNCSQAYGGSKGGESQLYTQVLGKERDRCHVYMEASMGAFSGWMNCKAPLDATGKQVASGNPQDYCTGPLVELMGTFATSSPTQAKQPG